MSRFSVWILVQLFCLILRADAQIKADDGPTESECRPYIEKALHELHPLSADASNGSPENSNIGDQISAENSQDNGSKTSAESQENNELDIDITKTEEVETAETQEVSVEDSPVQTEGENENGASGEKQASAEDDSNQQENESENAASTENDVSNENEKTDESTEPNVPGEESVENASQDTPEDDDKSQVVESVESENPQDEDSGEDKEDAKSSEVKTSSQGNDDNASEEKKDDESTEVKSPSEEASENDDDEAKSEENASVDEEVVSKETASIVEASNDTTEQDDTKEAASEENDGDSTRSKREASAEDPSSKEDESEKSNESDHKEDDDEDASDEQNVEPDTEIPEDELLSAEDSLYEHRNRSHISEILNLDNESKDKIINSVAEIILRDLKRIYENSIKPLEMLYKYRDLSNRHYGDSEIFSKPLILLMGPWSAGKSSIINYLTDNENTEYSLRSGAEPSPAYFNLIMYGDEPEVLDGTQLVADFTFSGLQKFGQGLEERLHGLKLPNKLLKKVNIVEIPGILEVRKQVSRQFPFNDACQWFIDRADIIFLVYDPSKLDVGLETEAILDQLKGREYQTRIILNKADKVKPDELLRVQSALMWNISPLMSSTQPPVMYTVSLWSRVFEAGAPTRLLQAQENALLKDVRLAIDKRIEHKIASARRFAVRVRNHAKMVDCYLTTYYNHKSLFGNKKRIADQIIENPQNYHIYEGLSTLTNISRYDLPDPEIYRGFFHLNALFEFKKLSETCTYFRGCPINKLDVAIAYDLPDLVGKYKREIDSAFTKSDVPGSS